MSEAWDGRPPGGAAERTGYHWLVPKAGARFAWPVLWCRVGGDFQWLFQNKSEEDAAAYAQHIADGSWTYGGPCPTPAEVAALVAAAERRGMERAARIADEAMRSQRRTQAEFPRQSTEWCAASEAASTARGIAAAIRAAMQEPGA